jgi:hypothetical protein
MHIRRRRGYHGGVFRHHDKPLEDKEYPDEADLDDGDDETLYVDRCPACGELVYEDAPQCPYCREWIVGSGSRWRESRKWYVRGGLYLVKTLLLNWLFWLGVVALAAAAFLVEALR